MPDLRVELRTATGSNTFQVGEVIPLEVAYSSTTPNRYLEPCEVFIIRTFGFPQCRFFNKWAFDTSPADGVADIAEDPRLMMRSGPTFKVPNNDLTQQPSVYTYPLTNYFRFDKPGQYHVRFITDVGIDDETTQIPRDRTIKPHSVPITRELVLNIIPANPAWEKTVIDNGISAFSPAAYEDTREPEVKKNESARLALCTLKSPGAMRAMARLIANDPPQFNRTCRPNPNGQEQCYETRSPVELGECIRKSGNTAPAIDEMQKLLVSPDVEVKGDLFYLLVALLETNPDRIPGRLTLEAPVVESVREKLFSALPQKRGDAFMPSLVTVLSVPPVVPHDSPERTFSPQIIAAAADHFEQLPDETQRSLLTDWWDRVDSPIMLPVVRRLAEGANGDALLRWIELDPQNADVFIRQQIVQPVPRFSSYYLRLPETSLPGDEKQIVRNFLALEAKYGNGFGEFVLARSATLVQRYATRRVLPSLLPAIDANLSNWPCSVQYPVLAYLLKVAPKMAAPRITKALAAVNKGECKTNMFLSGIGFLQPSPVLERIALEQVDLGNSPLARDGADYIRLYGSKKMKPLIWQRLVRWNERVNASGAEARMWTGKVTPEESIQLSLVYGLTEAFERAQAWVLTPEEGRALRDLPGQKRNPSEACGRHCGEELGVAEHKGPYRIDSQEITNPERIAAPLEYLNSKERLCYSVMQYRCADMKALEEKLLQFPKGSEFSFSPFFSPRDRNAMNEISNFLQEHGYKVVKLR